MSLSKLFQRIIWHNNTTPAINEDNLNAMSKAIDDIDNRVILIGDDVVTVIPQIQAYLEQAESIVEAVEELSQNPPYIGANGNWYVFDTTLEAYKDSGVDASITVDIADITMIAEGAQPYVTNTGTSTDPIFHLFLPRSPQGATGNGIANIAKTGTQGLVDTYTITMTDGTTYTFTVTNGQGIGDMTKAVYDSTNAVADAGGITDYVEGKVAPMLNVLGAKNLLNPIDYHDLVALGVTSKINSDGTVSLSGTATITENINITGWGVDASNLFDSVVGQEVILSDGTDANTYVGLLLTDANGAQIAHALTPNGEMKFTISQKPAIYSVYYHVIAGVDYTGVVLKPMLRLASIEDDTYAPYAMTNQQITPYIQAISNPNFLDNPWFTVNQRGLATAGATNSYFVDRWKTIRDDGTLTWNSSGITFATDLTGNSILLQSLEQGIDTSKQYTLSVMFSDGQIVSGIFNMASSPVLLGSKSGQAKIYTSYNSQYNAIIVWFNDLTQAITIRAIKLELGTQSTLAHDTAPNYAQELLTCQRYFQAIPISESIGRINASITVIKLLGLYLKNMKTPITSVTTDASQIAVSGAGSQKALIYNTDFSLAYEDGAGIKLTLTSTGADKLTNMGNQIVGLWDYTSKIYISADL